MESQTQLFQLRFAHSSSRRSSCADQLARVCRLMKSLFHQCIKRAISLSKYDQTDYHSSSINNNSQPFLLQFYRLLKMRSGRVRNHVIKLLYIYNKITNYFPTHQLYGIELYILDSQLALSIHRQCREAHEQRALSSSILGGYKTQHG